MNPVMLGLAKFSFRGRRQAFYADLAEALGDNANLAEYLEETRDQLARRRDVETGLFDLWLSRLDNQSFPQAIVGTVPRMDIMILGAADAAGNLTKGLRFLAMTVAIASRMKGALVGALTMPAFLGLMLVAYILVFGFVMEPMLESIAPPANWPFIGRVVYHMSVALRDYGVVVGAVVLAIFFLVAWLMPRWSGRTRARVDNIFPVYSIYRGYSGSIFLVALASLMQSDVGLAESLAELRREAMPWLRWHIDEIAHRLDGEADEPAKAFATGVFSQANTDRVESFGRRSNFEDAISKVGIGTVDKLVEQVTAIARVLNVASLMAVAVTLVLLLAGAGSVLFYAADHASAAASALRH
ncbi:hypothetical protein [Paraburkholderia unamae]|uniref:Type II secretory pathway component PulF n=1 Tax=Paraburkholderia unamae TaxID=219649 RepID=A0ABX5KSL0_9BURK|nr:hypothetical protein [Paraburkholderia unamae]PVX85829.1 type II secretory pathway component PulF [Paraburkholderia unamae]